MNNIFKKIKLHPLFCLSVFVIVITGQFKSFITCMSIVLFHEIGHISIGLLLKWKIEQIIILPFGCLTMFNEYINRPLIEEFLICIAGPIFQMIYYLIMSNFFELSYVHYRLLLFNLLPIIPLDGSKILNLILNKKMPFYFSEITSIFISLLLIVFLGYTVVIKSWNLMLFFTLFLLLIKTLDEFKNINYIFNKFLLDHDISLNNNNH